jgi:zinc-ribbon domain
MCVQCSREVSDDFRFCPHCGTAQRSKIVEYFRGHPDVGDGGLRVSAYLTRPQHLRFSVWRHERAEAAISLAPDEAHRLGRFLLAASASPSTGGSQLGRSLRRRARALQRAVSRR